MIRIRPYKMSDAGAILSWCRDEKEFYQWTAGVIGPYPTSGAAFAKLNDLMQFTALDAKEVVGYCPESGGHNGRAAFRVCDRQTR